MTKKVRLQGFAVLLTAATISFSANAEPVRRVANINLDPITSTLARLSEMSKKGDHALVLKKLEGEAGKQLAQAQLEPLSFWLKARALEALKRDDEAITAYASAVEKRNSYEAQILYSAAQLLRKKGDGAKARDYLNRLLALEELKTLPVLRSRAILEMAQVQVQEQKWREVDRLLQPAMKRTRGQEIYPSYAHTLLRAKMKLGKADCRLAKDLYAKYPSAQEVAAWGVFMAQNTIDDKKVGCPMSTKDIQTRFRRLQLGGQIDRSLKEIAELRARGTYDAWTTDVFEISSLLANGQNEDAAKLLMKHSEDSKMRPAFWNLLGKVASRMGDFSGAASSYMHAYKLAPRTRASSDALFNSAFASYQMQDYDGAEEGFGLLSARYGKSKIARDARWHLAWMSYLRGDLKTALDRWQGLLKERRGRRQKGDATSPDRIEYWTATALLRLGREKEAVELFRRLIRDPSIDYYAILAWYRLKAIPGVQMTDAEMRLGFRKAVGEEELKELVEAEKAEVVADSTEGEPATAEASAESAATDAPAEVVGEASAAGSEAVSADEALPDDVRALLAPSSGTVRDPALQKRLERVRQLFAAGFIEETRWELQSLDARVRHPQDRRLMMAELHRMGRWDRSSTLAELAFGAQRLRGGLDGARDLWEYAYPKAWSSFVVPSAKNAGVDEDLVWSIMRAESHYRAEARSPVGASGLMQIMPFTGERVARDLLGMQGFETGALLEPETNVRLGARYLRRLQDKVGPNLPLIAAGYNAGPHRVQAWLSGFGTLRMDEFIEHIPFVETRNYVKKVSRNFQIYRLLYRDDRGSLQWLVKPVGVAALSGPGAMDVW